MTAPAGTGQPDNVQMTAHPVQKACPGGGVGSVSGDGSFRTLLRVAEVQSLPQLVTRLVTVTQAFASACRRGHGVVGRAVRHGICAKVHDIPNMNQREIDMATPKKIPPQHQERQPGRESEMTPRPDSGADDYVGSGRLAGKRALVTGGDSGIGRAIAVAFAREGADVAIAYLDEHEDAQETVRLVEAAGGQALAIAGDLGEVGHAEAVVRQVLERFGELDILVNNAAEQHPRESLEDIDTGQLDATFRTNVFAMFHVTRAALPHLRDRGSILNTTSVTAYRGSAHLLDYSATKGAIVAFTRSLALQIVKRGIRVNGVAPGPIWTPLIPSTFSAEEVEAFGKKTPMGRPGQPYEVAAGYVFLASDAASYITGQILHINGGEVVNA
ncbi:NAD(P)-dependent dehydrogenase, short-chain alcohol dehydrogenase family [Cupriavidus sp. H19C3]